MERYGICAFAEEVFGIEVGALYTGTVQEHWVYALFSFDITPISYDAVIGLADSQDPRASRMSIDYEAEPEYETGRDDVTDDVVEDCSRCCWLWGSY